LTKTAGPAPAPAPGPETTKTAGPAQAVVKKVMDKDKKSNKKEVKESEKN
jgi:hypothetical protein